MLKEVHWFGYYDTGQALASAPFRIRLFVDGQGLPGAVFYEESVQANGMDTGMLTTGKPVLEYWVDLAQDVQLQANTTYWLSIAHANLPQFLWSRATTSDGANAFRNSDTVPWTGGNPADRDHAFTLEGDRVVPVDNSTWSRIKSLYAR